jgi:hypothetical protein
MIDGWFSVLIISLIVALGALAVLLVQSYRGDSLQHAEEAHLFPWHRVFIDIVRAVQERGKRFASAFTLGKRT